MSRVIDRLDKVPVLNIFSCLWNWADGEEYIVDDDKTVLPEELAESDRKTDASYDEHFRILLQYGRCPYIRIHARKCKRNLIQ